MEPSATDRLAPAVVPPSPRQSGAIAASPRSPLDPADSTSWIFVNFSGRMAPESEAGIVVHDAGGTPLPLVYDWTHSATSALVVKPQQALRPNTIYVFRLTAALVTDAAGNPLDQDEDGFGGEAPDDDLVFFYRTRRAGDRFTDLDRDGNWDSGSVYLDADRNGRFDPPPAGADSLLFDTFNDGSGAPVGDGFVNSVEPLIRDANQNGRADPGDTWYDNIANGFWDTVGEPLVVDLNANAVYDAPRPGDPLPLLADGFPPVVLPFGSTQAADGLLQFRTPLMDDTRAFVDAGIAVRVVDEALVDGQITLGPLPALVDGALRLTALETGAEWPGSVTYETAGVPTDDRFGRLTFWPAAPLGGGLWYELVVAGALADSAGNKLDRDRDSWSDSGTRQFLIRRFKTEAMRADGTVVAEDSLEPAVVDWEDAGFGFRVIFSELIDPRTLSDRTVQLDQGTGPVAGLLSVQHRFLGDPNQGPEVRLVTVVTFAPLDPAVDQGTATVTREVRDFAGHQLAAPASWAWVGSGGAR